jgi:hypothetical protein
VTPTAPDFPSMDLYPVHDKDGFLELATGLWLHTTETHGVPTEAEARATLAKHLPPEREKKAIELLRKRGQIADFSYTDDEGYILGARIVDGTLFGVRNVSQ